MLSFLLKKDGYGNLLKDCPNIIYISVGCGYMDIFSGGIKEQKDLAKIFCSVGINSVFFNFGITGHHPQYINRKKYVEWIINSIQHYTIK